MPEPQKLRCKPVKHVERAVTSYIRDECDKLHELSKNMGIDLKAIAMEGSVEHAMMVKGHCSDSRAVLTKVSSFARLSS